MSLSISAQNCDGQDNGYEYDLNPDICPICHTSIEPKRHIAAYSKIGYNQRERLQVVFRCTKRNCDSFFFGIYERNSPHEKFNFERSAPYYPREEVFSEIINKLSPCFVQIYNQAAASEALGLSEIAGIGYRKSLEFLIKDFTIQQNPNDED